MLKMEEKEIKKYKEKYNIELQEELDLIDSMIRKLQFIKEDVTILTENYGLPIPNLVTLNHFEKAHGLILILFYMLRGSVRKCEGELNISEDYKEQLQELMKDTTKDESNNSIYV